MESLQEILGSRSFTPPDEIQSVKDYVHRHYQAHSSVRLQRDEIIITVPSSALAATIQLERQKLIKACKLDGKRLVIRNGR